jgi:prepilin signal peptidase PulO-like enzyme (type II secretory pathway)
MNHCSEHLNVNWNMRYSVIPRVTKANYAYVSASTTNLGQEGCFVLTILACLFACNLLLAAVSNGF